MQEQNRGRRYNPITTSGDLAVSFESPELFGLRGQVARDVTYPTEEWFLRGLKLTHQLFAARAPKKYTEDLPKAITYLCVKALNDLLGAVLMVKNGYHFQSWPLLRGALEASELMDYFQRNPDEVRGWVNKEKRFDSLGRIRQTLPHPEFRKQLFDLLNENTHANVRNIDALSTYVSGPNRRTLAVGPLPFSPTENDTINMAASFISYPTRTMWRSDLDAVSADWVSEFSAFDVATGTLLSEDWAPVPGQDLMTTPPPAES